MRYLHADAATNGFDSEKKNETFLQLGRSFVEKILGPIYAPTRLDQEISACTKLLTQLNGVRLRDFTRLARATAHAMKVELTALCPLSSDHPEYRTQVWKALKEHPKFSQIEYLRLSDGGLRLERYLPREIGEVATVKNLHIYESVKPLRVSAELTQLTQLIELTIGASGLTDLPGGSSRLTNLKVLYLNRNQIAQFPAQILQLPRLEHLYIDGNPCPIPPEILQSTTLRTLNASRNQLQSLTQEQADDPRLRIGY